MKYSFSSNVKLDYLFQKQEYWKYLRRKKLLHPQQRHKLVHAADPSVIFLIGTLEDLTSSYSKLIEILIFFKCYTGVSVPKTRILEIFGKEKALSSTWKTVIRSCRSFCSPPFLNWEITGPYKFLLKINGNIDFLKMLHWIICSKNKNIGNFSEEVRSLQDLFQPFFS